MRAAIKYERPLRLWHVIEKRLFSLQKYINRLDLHIVETLKKNFIYSKSNHFTISISDKLMLKKSRYICEASKLQSVLLYFHHLHHIHHLHFLLCLAKDQYQQNLLKWKSAKKTKPIFEKKTSSALKVDRIIHRVTFNPLGLRVPAPRFYDDVVLVPGFLSLIFDSTVSGESNNFLVNNALRALVTRLTVKFAREIVQDTNGYDLFKLCEDLFLSESERESIMFREGSQSDDLSKIRCKAGNKYRIGLDYEIWKDHGVFFPRALSDELLLELKLAPASNVVIGSDKTQLTYELTNIHLEHKVMHSQELADDALFNYTNGKIFRCEHVNHLKAISIDKGTDSIINESVNAPRKSMRELLQVLQVIHSRSKR